MHPASFIFTSLSLQSREENPLRTMLRMLQLGSLAVVLASLWHAEAFVPDRNGGRSSLGRKSKSFALHMARYTPPVPVLPPPPPPPPSQPDILEQLSKDVSRFFESLHMPKLDTNLDLSNFKEQISAMASNLGNIELPKLEQLGQLKEQIATLDASILAKLDQVARGLETGLLRDYPSVQPLYEKVTAVMTPLLASHPSLTIALSTAISYQLVSQILSIGQAPPPAQPYPDDKYDPASARQYFDQRPLQVISRGLQIAVLSLQFGLELLKDKIEYVSATV
jgi:hypothetical protein